MSLVLLLLLACPTPEPPPEPPVVRDEPAIEVAEPEPLPEPTEPRYAATHVLVTWQGAVRARASITRDEGVARALAAELRERAVAGESLEELARTYSDGPSAPRGGQLGVYATGTMIPDFERAVASVGVGEVAPLVRTPFGYHVARRDPVEEVRMSHVLVTWQGALRSGTDRSKEDARAQAEAVVARLAAGEDFAAVAAEVSEDATRLVGGDLGLVAHGQMMPTFEDVAFALEVGERSDIVETPYGFHVLLRTE